MPVVIFFARLDLEQKSLFLNGDYANCFKLLDQVKVTHKEVVISKRGYISVNLR